MFCSQSEQNRFYQKRLRLPWRKVYMLGAGGPTKSKHLSACFQCCLVGTLKLLPTCSGKLQTPSANCISRHYARVCTNCLISFKPHNILVRKEPSFSPFGRKVGTERLVLCPMTHSWVQLTECDLNPRLCDSRAYTLTHSSAASPQPQTLGSTLFFLYK